MKKVYDYKKDRVLAGMIFVLWSFSVLLPFLRVYNINDHSASQPIEMVLFTFYVFLNIVAFFYALLVFSSLTKASMKSRDKEKKVLFWRMLLYAYALVGLLAAIYFTLQELV